MSQRLRHTINFTDSAASTRKAKPAGVLGVEKNRAATVRERLAACVRALNPHDDRFLTGAALMQPTPTDPALPPLPSRA